MERITRFQGHDYDGCDDPYCLCHTYSPRKGLMSKGQTAMFTSVIGKKTTTSPKPRKGVYWKGNPIDLPK